MYHNAFCPVFAFHGGWTRSFTARMPACLGALQGLLSGEGGRWREGEKSLDEQTENGSVKIVLSLPMSALARGRENEDENENENENSLERAL